MPKEASEAVCTLREQLGSETAMAEQEQKCRALLRRAGGMEQLPLSLSKMIVQSDACILVK